MTLVLETGALVANANTFVVQTDVDAYATARFLEGWARTTTNKEYAILRAADWLKNEARLPYRGARITSTQTMPWPRTGASELNGPSIGTTIIPWRLKDAQCELAILVASGVDLQPNLDASFFVKEKTVDVLTTIYRDDRPVETLFATVMGLLTPILRPKDAGLYNPVPSLQQVVQQSPFTVRDFTFPGNPPAVDPVTGT